MFSLTVWVFIFIISLIALVKASDYFTEAAEIIGLRFKLPVFIIGVTIVALGTSLPELISSIFAVLSNNTEIVASNVIGSNIANIFLVLGLSALFAKKMKVSYELIRVDLPLLAGSAMLLAVTIWDGLFTLGEAILCFLGLAVYLTYTVGTQKKGKKNGLEQKIKTDLKKIKTKTKEDHDIKPYIILITSAIFIFIGAKYTIESVIGISQIIGIGTQIIAVTAIALGTSLPELTVSITAARKGKAEIAIGNVLGSNIFNSFAVMAIPTLISPLKITEDILSFSLPMMLIATLLYFFMAQDKEITKYEGGLLFIFYLFFIGKIFNII